jgi:hypothetical protein
MAHPTSSHPEVFCSIAHCEDIGFNFERLEWSSFVNSGTIISVRVKDPYWNILKQLGIRWYLATARKIPTELVWEVKWSDTNRTGKNLAYLTNLRGDGINAGGMLDFVGLDPASYLLSAGDSSGRTYQGSVKEVIEQVLEDYFVRPLKEIEKEGIPSYKVSDVVGGKNMRWHMMRMDPRTFIMSLLDWSSSLTEKKTNWLVSNGPNFESGEEPYLLIEEQAVRPSKNYGTYLMNVASPGANDILSFELLTDNFVSMVQSQLVTQGISAISGKFYDNKSDPGKVKVYDENTSEKRSVEIDADRGFAKPHIDSSSKWSTSIRAIPEHNAGDLGISYRDYIDGRARGMFLNMLNAVMRIKIRVLGDASKDLANSHNLGVSRLKISWVDPQGQPYFLDGEWLVYGFHHIVTRGSWTTDIYCARLDWDSEAQTV